MSRCPYHSPTHSHWSGQRDLDQDVDLDDYDYDGDGDDGGDDDGGQGDLDQDVDLDDHDYADYDGDGDGDDDGDHDNGQRDLEQDVDLDHHRPCGLLLETKIRTLAEKRQAAKILLLSSHPAILEQFSACFHAVAKLPTLATITRSFEFLISPSPKPNI